MKAKDVIPGMVVKLNPKQWSSFVDTSKIGVVLGMPFPERHFSIEVLFTDGTVECYAPRHLREVS